MVKASHNSSTSNSRHTNGIQAPADSISHMVNPDPLEEEMVIESASPYQ
jgi:hypothetical protein